jgi:hypothetical protein
MSQFHELPLTPGFLSILVGIFSPASSPCCWRAFMLGRGKLEERE